MASVSKAGDARHWAAINEASFVGGMRLLFWVCRVFGRWPFRVVLYPVLAWYVATQARARRASSGYLARVGAPHGFTGVLRHFGAFAEAILDKMLIWGGLFDLSKVTVHGDAPLLEMIKQGRGALLLCSHLGNLDLCRALSMRTPGLRITVLVHTRHAEAFNAMLGKLDPRSQLNLMQVTEMTPAMAMVLSERIERGEFVVIAGDRVPVASQPRVARVPFMGDTAAFPIGPYVMASVLGCPMYALFSTRQGDAYELHFERLRERVSLPRATRGAALAELAGEYAARLEHHARCAPLEWFNFYDFWQHTGSERPDAIH
ncbi:LpxL/LpxP family acyltransferase [Telluria aromaticivorans]|uniref:Acyltransferase n=1 Tax=Telluria aromaticivorans TaxID=2725995 RepID=A0A7Y2NZJ4_9BURK|nr:acyltransferase [Telluria aromaticivorans]NNG21869.1 acyltransferase [Telluria aromaticivorans]